jgi:hypothetical protein
MADYSRTFLFSLFVVLPSGLRVANIVLLPFLGSTGEQDD